MKKEWYRILMALLFCLSLSDMGSVTVYAQNATKKITVSLKNAPIDEFFNVVRKQTGLNFIMTSVEKRRAPLVSIDEKNQPADVIIKKVLGSLGYSYNIQNGVISIRGRLNQDNTRKFTGTITDSEGEVLPGVHIHLIGTKIYTTANDDGTFIINIPINLCDVEFSFVGMRKKKVHFNTGEQDILKNIVMKSATDIDEVVVTGYQDFDKTRMAGSVAQISAKDMNIDGFNSIEQALQGKLAGFVVQNQSGMVGVKQKTRIRGTSTMMGSQEPIWVVDGVIQEDPLPFSATEFDSQGSVTEDNFDYIRNFVGNSIAWLNPMDIDRITVLKDASATAIYGVRAANGVIVINTKRGKVGSLAVSYSGALNVGERVSYNSLEMMNSRERVAVSKEIFQRGLSANWSNNNIGYAGVLNDYLFGRIDSKEFERQVEKLETNNTDWFDILFRNPVSHNHSISFSGGSEKARYYSSLSYNKTNGTAIGNDQNTYGAHVGLNMDFGKRLHVNFDLGGAYTRTNSFYGGFDAYNYALKTNRAIPCYNEDGSLFFYQNRSTNGNYGGFLFNVLNERDNTGNNNRSQNLTASVNAYYDITSQLKFNTLVNVASSSVYGESWATERSTYITAIRNYEYGTALPTSATYKNSKLPNGGELNTTETNRLTWSWRNTLQYDKLFNHLHALTAMIGLEISSNKYNGVSSTAYGYMPSRGKSFATVPVGLTNPYSGAIYANPLLENLCPTITDSKTNQMGAYLTLNYAYDNRYVVNFNVRGDASNRFGQNKNERFNPVFAGGLRWNLSREQWFQKQNIISDASIRASFGYQRNMASNVSPSLIVKIPRGAASSIVDQRTGDYLLNISKLPYDDLRWEKTFSQNYGLDLGILNNQIRIGVEYYYKKGVDMISLLDIPREYGIESMPVNGGSMKNSGYELTVGLTPIRTKDFTWNLSFNTAKNFNEVTKVGKQNQNWTSVVLGNYYKQGYPIGSIWAFRNEGIDPETGYPIINLDVAEGADTTDPTTYMEYAGKLDPDFTGGLSMSFRYKQFTLSTSFYLQLGGKRFLTAAYQSTYLPSEFENMTNELVGRWTPDTPNSNFPGLPDKGVVSTLLPDGSTYATVYQMYNYSMDRVVDASSLRCNAISFSYSFANTWLQKCHIPVKSLSLSGTINNIFTIHSGDFKGRDPEVAMGQQPRTRSFSMNLNVSF